MNIYNLIDINTTIGKLRTCLVFTDDETTGNQVINVDYYEGDSIETSICGCPQTEGSTAALTGAFDIIGNSGEHYPVTVSDNQLIAHWGNVQFTWGGYFNDYGKGMYFPVLYWSRYNNIVGVRTASATPANDPDWYTLTFSQVSTGRAGYLYLTYNRDLLGMTQSYVNYDATESDFGQIIEDILEGGELVSEDPYNPDGDVGNNSRPGGGTGNFDGTGDSIDIPSLPTLSAVDAGFITLFNPSISQMQNLASYMWSNPLFDLDAWKKIFADPMDAILGLSIVPVAVPNGGSKTVTVGNIPTGVTMTVAAQQYVEVDCGTLNVNEYWGAYLDYDPYTKAEIYLPYCGTHPLAVDDIMGKAVTVKYHVDILSGACTAFVKCGNSVLYEFIGQCSSSIPITGDNWTNVINGVISIAGSIGTMVATGGASAPMAAGQIAATMVNTMKPSVEKSGAMGGTGGMLAVQTPYLILTRPRQALPANQNKFMGYPSFITENLGSLTGYTEVENIRLDNVPATEQELAEIEQLLKGGVII